MIIAPSILGGSFSNMEKIITEIDQSSAQWVHLDVMDGDFVPNLTFGPKFIKDMRPFTNKVFDVHLMTSNVFQYLENYKSSGSDGITFHVEINEDIKKNMV